MKARRIFSVVGLLTFTVVALCCVQPACGGVDTWTGGASVSWSNSNNWNPLAIPVANDSLVFAGATQLSNTNDLAAGTRFNGLTFDASAGAFTLSGNTINLGGDIINNSAFAQTVALPLSLQGTYNSTPPSAA